MTRRLAALTALAPLVLGAVPVNGPAMTSIVDVTDELDAVGAGVGALAGVDVVEAARDDTFASPGLVPVGLLPELTAISTEFAADEPVMYVSTLTGIRTYDISDPTRPQLLGALPMALFQNENVKLGEREDGTKFLLVGFDTVGVMPTFEPTDVADYDEIAVVEVTDPTDPRIVARIETNHSTHTVGCANDECTHAFTSGDGAAFDVINLDDPAEPFIEATITGQPQRANDAFATGIGHDWDVDEAGVAWWVGTGGIVAYDVADPADPTLLNSSDRHSRDPAWNGYVTHNSVRPNAQTFDPDDPDVDVDAGNVLLVTEEDYLDVSCASEGSFQTWHVPALDPATNPRGVQDGGSITPLDQWNSELLDTGIPTPAGAFCSAHYFDYHQDGYVAQGWYQQGLRILDVNDATDIRQLGYWVTGVQETWGAYWVPEYDEQGRQTGDKTNLVYTNDPTRGMEILEVDLPEQPGSGATVEAPVLASWLNVDPTMSLRASASDFGGVCLLPPGRLPER